LKFQTSKACAEMKTITVIIEKTWKGHLQGQLEAQQNTQNIATSSTREKSGSPKCIL